MSLLSSSSSTISQQIYFHLIPFSFFLFFVGSDSSFHWFLVKGGKKLLNEFSSHKVFHRSFIFVFRKLLLFESNKTFIFSFSKANWTSNFNFTSSLRSLRQKSRRLSETTATDFRSDTESDVLCSHHTIPMFFRSRVNKIFWFCWKNDNCRLMDGSPLRRVWRARALGRIPRRISAAAVTSAREELENRPLPLLLLSRRWNDGNEISVTITHHILIVPICLSNCFCCYNSSSSAALLRQFHDPHPIFGDRKIVYLKIILWKYDKRGKTLYDGTVKREISISIIFFLFRHPFKKNSFLSLQSDIFSLSSGRTKYIRRSLQVEGPLEQILSSLLE